MVSRETSTFMQDLRFVLQRSITAVFGVIPLGLAFGLFVHASGFAWFWTPVISILIYAGSSEFLAVSFLLTGVGPVAATLSGLMINFRHIFYGMTAPVPKVRGKIARAYAMYSLTDEAYVTYSARPDRIDEEWSGRRIVMLHCILQSAWVLPGIIGALCGQVLPPQIHGMDFALTALFTVLGYEAWKGMKKSRGRYLALALLCAAVGTLFPLHAMLLVGMSIYFLILVCEYRGGRS